MIRFVLVDFEASPYQRHFGTSLDQFASHRPTYSSGCSYNEEMIVRKCHYVYWWKTSKTATSFCK